MSQPVPVPLWFVGGLGRSGTTILAGLVSDATGGFNAGELQLLWRSMTHDRVCTCGDPVRSCVLWRRVSQAALTATGLESIEQAAALEAGLPRQRYSLIRGWKLKIAPEITALRQATEDAIRDATGCPTIIDSSKLGSAAVLAARLDRPCKIIHLVRDPRGVAYSFSRRLVDKSDSHWPMPRYGPVECSIRWNVTNLAFERLAQQPGLRTSYRRVLYEGLVADPIGELLPIGLTVAEARPSPGAHGIAGNPWRFAPGRSLEMDEEWRARMTPGSRRVVEILTKRLMRRYGYMSGVGATANH